MDLSRAIENRSWATANRVHVYTASCGEHMHSIRIYENGTTLFSEHACQEALLIEAGMLEYTSWGGCHALVYLFQEHSSTWHVRSRVMRGSNKLTLIFGPGTPEDLHKIVIHTSPGGAPFLYKKIMEG